jgi:tetratricopeptide (TPR) repeat protein/transglutaminase-like putative cysteine protease
VAAVDPKITSALGRAREAHGPAAYVALRELWRRWDQGDPQLVEEAILAVERDPAVAPPIRVYAGMLSAYARRRRGDLEGARRKLRTLGFLDQWFVVGPFDNEAKSSLFSRFGPELDLRTPLNLQKTYEGKEHPLPWRHFPDVASFGWLDLGNALRPSEKVCGYATTFVRARPGKKGEEREQKATLWVGAGGSFRAFWNGDDVLADVEYRALDADRLSANITLRPGWNRLTLKICGDEEGPMAQARIGDEHGGALAVEQKADPSLAELAAKNSARPAKSDKKTADRGEARPARGVTVVSKGDPYARGAAGESNSHVPAPAGGPLAGLSRALTDPRTSVADLDAHARYLAMTGGEAHGQHQARDLASRAAEAAPAVDRLLLASELAEDRNARAAWLQKARAQIGTPDEEIDVLLAEAILAREGTNPREATPIFERVLAREPGNIPALLGRALLYDEAGLRHSALATLEQAVNRLPRSIALLRAYAHQLRAVGRASDAEEAERRYANLRFDDVTYLRAQVELFLARRDTPQATRWLERLLELDPESLGTLEFAARSFRALGNRDRAVATLERRLEIAPEDVDALRALAELQGEDGRQDEQLKLLRKILALRPQAKDVREYLEHSQPPKIRRDEAFAWEKDQLMALAQQPPVGGPTRRTLRDLQVTTVYPNGLASRFHQIAYQPLTDEAAASGRQYAFSYQAGREVIDLRAARVFRASGQVDEAIETGEGGADNPAMAMYSSARTFYVQLPRLNPGDVVELRYRVEEITPRNEYGDSFSETAYVQSTEPLLSSEYVLITPRTRKVLLRDPSLPGFTREESDEGELHLARLSARNVPAVVPEPNMPPLLEQVATTSASTFSSWDEVGKWFWGLSRDQFDADDEVRARVKEITKGLTTDEEKVRAVYDYVVQRTRYVALEFGIEGFRPRRCALTLARGWGDCKDKATVIVTMLRELGIPANFVLIRTTQRGEAPPEPPSYAFFDHAIAYVPKLDIFLDGTAEYTGMNELPAFDRGAYGLIVSDGGAAKLVRLPEPGADKTVRSRHIEVSVPDGSGPAAVDVTIEATGAVASAWRQQFHAAATQRARVVEELGGEFGGLTLQSGASGLEVNDLENVEQPVKLRLRGKALGFQRNAGGDLTFSASPIGSLVARYASLSTRHQDIKLPFSQGFDDEWAVKLSPSVSVKHVPADASLQSPFGTLEIKVERTANRLIVRSKLRLTRTRIKPAEYADFRAFCESVDRALNDRVSVGK